MLVRPGHMGTLATAATTSQVSFGVKEPRSGMSLSRCGAVDLDLDNQGGGSFDDDPPKTAPVTWKEV